MLPFFRNTSLLERHCVLLLCRTVLDGSKFTVNQIFRKWYICLWYCLVHFRRQDARRQESLAWPYALTDTDHHLPTAQNCLLCSRHQQGKWTIAVWLKYKQLKMDSCNKTIKQCDAQTSLKTLPINRNEVSQSKTEDVFHSVLHLCFSLCNSFYLI